MGKEYKEWKAKHIPQYENKNEEEGSRARLGQGYMARIHVPTCPYLTDQEGGAV